jgi:integrase/recombinase XerD
MSENPSSAAALDQWIANWLAHQRALGRGYNREEWVLEHLRRFVETIPSPDLDQSGFDLWCDASRHLSATTRRGQQLIVRKFCLYRQRTEPRCFVPNPLYFVQSCPYRGPVIIEPAHIARLLVAADNLTPTTNSPLLPTVMRFALVVL